ncbi:hypothetical protein JTB14_021679 [Gonioctena quinquepunctata]|nr:hypothetical protein JTB14_021679 [Gonioctena quinquepunctata]
MMRSVICFKKNVDIQKYPNLLAFLKKNAVGYQSTKPKLLTKQELNTFLKEADDNIYLLMKVALIIGMSGSCSRDELSYLLTNDVKDEGYYFRITITSNQTRSHRDFIILDETTNGINLVDIIRNLQEWQMYQSTHTGASVSVLFASSLNENQFVGTTNKIKIKGVAGSVFTLGSANITLKLGNSEIGHEFHVVNDFGNDMNGQNTQQY